MVKYKGLKVDNSVEDNNTVDNRHMSRVDKCGVVVSPSTILSGKLSIERLFNGTLIIDGDVVKLKSG